MNTVSRLFSAMSPVFKKKLMPSVFALLLACAFFAPSPALASNAQGYPKEINGLPVVFVHTSTNTVGLVGDQAVLVLYDSSPESFENAHSRWDFSDYWKTHSLPENWTITVIGGAQTSVDSYLQQFKKNNGKLIQRPNGSALAPNPALVTDTQTNPTFAEIQDIDPSSRTVTGMRAEWYSPQTGPYHYQTNWSSLDVTGYTNGADWLQCGQSFGKYGDNYNFWSQSYYGGVNQIFNNVPYITGDLCWFTLDYLGGTVWEMSAYDQSTGSYQSVQQYIVGTYLQTSVNTAIWFENWNTNPSWYAGFTNPCSVIWADDFNGSYWQSWSYQQITIVDAYHQTQSNNGKITGSLTNHGTANWYLDKLLLAVVY